MLEAQNAGEDVIVYVSVDYDSGEPLPFHRSNSTPEDYRIFRAVYDYLRRSAGPYGPVQWSGV